MALLTSQPVTQPQRRALRLFAAAQYWHLLSLDAPSVAALWAWSFGRALRVSVSAESLLLLFSGTWLLYIVDRIFDGLRADSARLRERHLFYIRHRATVLAAAIPVAMLVVWLTFAHMLPSARRDDVIIFSVAATYFFIVHRGGHAVQRWFPKELVVSIVFASATAVPAYAHAAVLPAAPGRVLPVLAALFAALCWLNCVAIEKWEQTATHPALASRSQCAQQFTTRWGQKHFRAIAAVLALAATAAALLLHSNPYAAALCCAASCSAVLLFALDRAPLSAFHLRIAADAALLTPLLLLFLR